MLFSIKKVLNVLYNGGFGILLIALLALFLFYPLATDNVFARNLLLVLSYVSVYFGLKWAGYNKKLIYFLPLLGFLSIVLDHSTAYFPNQLLQLSFHFSTIIFYSISCYNILLFVFNSSRIDTNKIFAAICVYFLLGLIWSFIFSAIDTIFPGSFHYNQTLIQDDLSGTHFIYYSFVTITTLGYGDISPLSAPARSLAVLEAFTGQLYLAILVARLVGLHIVDSKKRY